MADLLGIFAGLALGAYLGWFVLRSNFSFDRVFRWPVARDSHEWLRAYLLAMAISWVFMAPAYYFHWAEFQAMPDSGPIAFILAGLLAGLAVGMLGQCPLTIILGAGMTSIWAVIAAVAMMTGIIAGLNVAWLDLSFDKIRVMGSLSSGWQAAGNYGGMPGWVILPLAGIALGSWLIGHPVVVRRTRMEWPKQGGMLAVIVLAGWALALAGGQKGGLNLVEAINNVWIGLTGLPLEFRPALLVLFGLAGWGFISAIRSGKLFSDPVNDPMQLAVLVAASFLLGISCALGKGDPVSHCLYGAGAMQVSSLLFAGGMWGGAALFGRLGKRLVRKGDKQ